MKKFIVYLLVIVVTVSLGFAIFYLVRDNEVISISSASIYKDAGEKFTLDIEHSNKKRQTEITVTSSDEEIVSGRYDEDDNQYQATALKGGVARINVRTTNSKFRNLWCDVIVGDGTIESPYYISTAEQLAAIGMGAEISDGNGNATGVYAGATGYEQYHSDLCYKLVANIDAAGVNNGFWVPLQNFTGRFDGNGHTISNIYINADEYQKAFGDKADIRFMTGKNAGLFSTIGAQSVVYNFKLENYIAVGTYGEFGTVAAVNYGTIERIEVKDAYLSIKTAVFGGIVARNETTERLVVNTDEQGNETASYVRDIAKLDRNSINLTLGQNISTDSNGDQTISILGATGTIGGVAGINNGGTIVYCYSKGNVYFGNDNGVTYGGIIGSNNAISGLHYNEKNNDESEYQGANMRDCYSNLITTLASSPSATSLFGGVIGINQDYKIGEIEVDDGSKDNLVNNYIMGVYYNKENLNHTQESITKEFKGIAKFLLNTNTVNFSDKETIVYGLTTAEMKDPDNFVSHVSQALVFNEDGTSKGIMEKEELWLFESVWAISTDTNDGMPYLNFQLVYVPDDFESVGVPVTAKTLDKYYFVIEVNYPVSIISGTDGKVRMKVEEYYQLVYSPTGIKMEWTTSDKKIVTVDNQGKLYGVSAGVATVTVTTKSGSQATVTVIVENIPYKIDAPSTIYLYQNEKFDLSQIEVSPDPLARDTLSYTITDTDGVVSDIAYINNNQLVASSSKTGTAILTIKIADTALEVNVVVVEAPAVKMYASPRNISGYLSDMTKTGTITISDDLDEAIKYNYRFISGAGVVDLNFNANDPSNLNYTIKAVGNATVRIGIDDDIYGGKGTVDIYFTIKSDETVSLTMSPSTITGYYTTMSKTGSVTVSNSAGTTLSYTASSNKTSVVTVSMNSNALNYTIKGIGSAIVTVNVSSKHYKGVGYVYFNVLEPVTITETINLSKTTLTLTEGNSSTITATGSYSKLTWSSSNTSVATVNSSGKVTAIKAGSATITAKSDYAEARCTVYVNAKPSSTPSTPSTPSSPSSPSTPSTPTVNYSISVRPTSVTLNVNDQYTLSASGTYSSVSWSSSKTSVATINSSGVVTAKAAGSTTITATAKDSSGNAKAYAYCTITVTSPTIITLTSSKSSAYKGETVTFTASVNKSITVSWSYSGPATFTKNGNTLTAKTTGTGTLSVTASSGSASASKSVTVSENTAYSQNIYNLDDLNRVRYNLDKKYYLAANISVGNWTPIENFTGSLSNLGSFTLSNITVSGKTNAGLFGSVSGASFTNIIITNSSFSGTNAGTIAGKASGTSFSGCSASSTTVTGSKYAGGIVGYMNSTSTASGCTVTSCTIISTGNTGYSGGIVGYASGSTVSSATISGGSISLGSSAHGYAGGAVGYLASSKVTGTLVYNAATVTANNASNDYAGGICGKTDDGISDDQTITSSTIRNVTITGYYAGGIGGTINSSKNITLNFSERGKGYRSQDLSSSSYKVSVQTTAVRDTVTVKGTMVGGLFGTIDAGVVQNCYTRAKLNGTSSSSMKAGFAVYISSSSAFKNSGGTGKAGLVRYCYAACTFSGSGSNYAITFSPVHNYVGLTNDANTTRSGVGYVMDYLFDDTLDGNAQYQDGSNIFSSDQVKARKSTTDMKKETTYTNKGFSSTYWKFGSSYPTLNTDR